MALLQSIFSVPAVNLEKIPPSVSFEEAAAFSLVFQTAWRMLKTRSAIQSGDTVFIHGIGGGVGSAALHIVKLLGGCAFVSSSSDAKLACRLKQWVLIIVTTASNLM